MPTLSITKSYVDGTVLTEADLDNIRTDLTTFFNTTKIDSDNIQANGVQGSKLNANVVDNVTLQYTSSQLSVKALGVTRAKIAVIDQIPAGCVQQFHTFNGTVSIPRGWMPLDGDVVSEANYEVTHGAGTYATDGVAASPLLTKTLPDMTGKYPVGAAATTQDGSGAITAVGNASNQVDISHVHAGPSHTHTGPSHNHQWLNDNGTVAPQQTFDASGATVSLTASAITTGAAISVLASAGGDASTLGTGGNTYTSNSGTGNTGASGTANTSSAGSATQSIQPHSIEFIYIMKVI